MKNYWLDADAKSFEKRLAIQGFSSDISYRVYTSQLLGGESRLVLHGGGNTSVKTKTKDQFGELVDILCVKGSGWDLADIEPAGLPAVLLDPLLKLRNLDALSDEDMMNLHRQYLVDSRSPNPSVETLLHAFLPHKFVDHTHADAILSITNQPNGEELAQEVWGSSMGMVPYIMPGFLLAKIAADIYEKNPKIQGLILLNHGIFTFGSTARESYERMINAVTLAEKRLTRFRKKVFASVPLPGSIASVREVAPIVRGACAAKQQGDEFRRMILEFRTSPEIRNYVDGQELGRYSQNGVITPDHTIRTKNVPLILPVPIAGNEEEFAVLVSEALERFALSYHDYFVRNNQRVLNSKSELDPLPRVILIPGLGLFGLGASSSEARVAADIAETTVLAITDAEAIGRYECLSEADLFDIEYWSLEQIKVGKGKELPFARQVVVVTGGGRGIGAATAKAFSACGAEIAILDINLDEIQEFIGVIGKNALVIECDVTDESSLRHAFEQISARFGGVDVLVSNAGSTWQGRIGEVEETTLRQSFELNFFAHQKAAQAAVSIMKRQGTGGVLLFNASKQAINPGQDFGPYGIPKAATLALMRQYALDYGVDGIRANAVNADRIKTDLLNSELIAARSAARNVSELEYMSGNLLGQEVTVEDVAQTFISLALARRTTAAIITVDGGNIAASVR